MRIIVAGASRSAICGGRDYAATLEPYLRAGGTEVQTVWWDRHLDPSPAEWIERIRATAASGTRPAVILWHYSPFTYGTHGLPLLVPRLLRAFRSTGIPLVPVFHELAYRLDLRGARGRVHGLTQRAALVPILRAASGAIVTTEDREAWLTSRRWLPSVPVAFIPVPSNVPRTGLADHTPNGTVRVGVFGFRSDGHVREVVTEAVPRSSDRARLVLVGAPGPDSPQADLWRAAATASGCPLEFTGVLEPAALSAALAGLDIVVFPSSAGPTGRKGTLAAALAHGRPVVALDGPERWSKLVEEQAVVLAAHDAGDLAAALAQLAESPELRANQGDQGEDFYRRHQSPEIVAERVLAFARRVAA
jgi:glycosyltransferase involved in cell wall biosynthesis